MKRPSEPKEAAAKPSTYEENEVKLDYANDELTVGKRDVIDGRAEKTDEQQQFISDLVKPANETSIKRSSRVKRSPQRLHYTQPGESIQFIRVKRTAVI